MQSDVTPAPRPCTESAPKMPPCAIGLPARTEQPEPEAHDAPIDDNCGEPLVDIRVRAVVVSFWLHGVALTATIAAPPPPETPAQMRHAAARDPMRCQESADELAHCHRTVFSGVAPRCDQRAWMRKWEALGHFGMISWKPCDSLYSLMVRPHEPMCP